MPPSKKHTSQTLENVIRRGLEAARRGGNGTPSKRDPYGLDAKENLYSRLKRQHQKQPAPSASQPHMGINSTRQGAERLKARLRTIAGNRLQIGEHGGFAVGQLVRVANIGSGMIIAFYRHDAYPYDYEWCDGEANFPDGGIVRAEVLVDSDFIRADITDLSNDTGAR